jgi:DNA-binding HxlR family transcriptional regulator
MREAKRSSCPIACALDVFGDRWTLLVLRDLACGRSLFKEFCASPERIATNILTDRLHRLVQHGLVERFLPDEPSGRDAYRLTARGKTIVPVLKSIAQWGLANIEGTEARMKLSSDVSGSSTQV